WTMGFFFEALPTPHASKAPARVREVRTALLGKRSYMGSSVWACMRRIVTASCCHSGGSRRAGRSRLLYLWVVAGHRSRSETIRPFAGRRESPSSVHGDFAGDEAQ